MAVSIDDVKASFPEFDLGTDPQNALITAKLAEAAAQVDASLFQNSVNADSAVKYLCAHLLALSPAGINARLAKIGDSTIYYSTYQRLIRAAAAGYRVP